MAPALSSAGDPAATTRPPSRTTIRSASRSTSVRSWLVSRTAAPSSRRPATIARVAARASGIHAGRRLVEDHDLGPADQGQRQPEPLPLPAGQTPVARPGDGGQADQLEQLVGVARVGVEAAVLAERLARPGARVDAAVLEHQPDASTQGRPTGCRIGPQHASGAAVGASIALDDLDRRRLAGAVRSEQRDQLAAADRQRDAVEDRARAVALDQPVDDDHRVAVRHGAIRLYWRSKSASVSSPTWIDRMTPVRSTK